MVFIAVNGMGQKTAFSDATCTTVSTHDVIALGTCSNGLKMVNCSSSDPNELGGGDYTGRRLLHTLKLLTFLYAC
jgi:hypothetical protein